MTTVAELIVAGAPCSIELPAGAGKTQLVAEIAAANAANSGRSLILTHTHTGVDAMRRRLRSLQVPTSAAHITTIDSWSFQLARRMPFIAEMSIPDPPDWGAKATYCSAASRVIQCHHIRQVLKFSYQLVLVDEYQDCSLDQHQIVRSVSAAVPTIVLGDRLQGLFDFERDTPLVQWQEDVQSHFPDYPTATTPWRWRDTAPDLGDWLQSTRGPLRSNRPVNLHGAPLSWHQFPRDPKERQNLIYSVLKSRPSGSVVAIGRFRNGLVATARRLHGRYKVMEPLHGSQAPDFCALVDGGPGPALATGTAEFAKQCLAGVADILTTQRIDRMATGNAPRVKDPRAAKTIEAFTWLLTTGNPADVLRALNAARVIPGSSLHCAELWHEVRATLQLAVRDANVPTTELLTRQRARSSHSGRRAYPATISTPQLIKGLEYDHAIILDGDGYTPEELYVALTRGRQTLTVLSKSATLAPVSR